MILSLGTTKTYLSLKVRGKGAPLHFPQQGPYGEGYSVSGANDLFIQLCLNPQVRSPPTKVGKTYGHCPQSPMQTEGLHTMGCGLVPQGDRFMTLVSPPQCHAAFSTVPSTLAWVASVCRSNPQQGISSTSVTTSHVTQGRVRSHVTLRYG